MLETKKEFGYSFEGPKWKEVPLNPAGTLPMARSRYGGGIVDNRLFIIGGYDNHEVTNKVDTMGVLDIIDLTPLLAGISDKHPAPACESKQITLPGNQNTFFLALMAPFL